MTFAMTAGLLDLFQRVHTWRLGVFEASISPNESANKRRHSSKKRRLAPYQISYSRRHVQSPSVRPPSVCSCPSAACDDNGESFLERQTASYGPRELKTFHDLPDSTTNPLITEHHSLIEEEYCRVLELYSRYESEKVVAEEWWMSTSHPDAMQALLDAGIAVQLILKASLYIEEYSQRYGMAIDFRTLFLRHWNTPRSDLGCQGLLADDWKFLLGERDNKLGPHLTPRASLNSPDSGGGDLNFLGCGQPSERGCVVDLDSYLAYAPSPFRYGC